MQRTNLWQLELKICYSTNRLQPDITLIIRHSLGMVVKSDNYILSFSVSEVPPPPPPINNGIGTKPGSFLSLFARFVHQCSSPSTPWQLQILCLKVHILNWIKTSCELLWSQKHPIKCCVDEEAKINCSSPRQKAQRAQKLFAFYLLNLAVW